MNTFETTIRMLGGLLSAHYLSTEFPSMAPLEDDDPGTPGEDLYLEKAKDLGDRLLAAFESPSGIPYASVNLEKLQGIPSHSDMGASSTAEATSLQLEFKYLAKLTGEKHFWDKAEKVMEIVDGNNAQDGLVPIYIYATNWRIPRRKRATGQPWRFILRILDQAVSSNEQARASVRADVERVPPRCAEASGYLHGAVRVYNHWRTPRGPRRRTVSEDGPPRVLHARDNRTGCYGRSYGS